MKEAKALKGVSKFHKLFELPIQESPAIPSKERCELRINLLEEELRELKEAIEKELPKNIPHVFISSITGQGLIQLKDMLWETLNTTIE